MRFGYWLPVFGGWLRNVDDEGMEATWAYAKRLAQRSEQIGFDLTLVAELNLNDIKGMDAPSLDALVNEVVPPSIRRERPLSLPPAQSEYDYLRRLRSTAARTSRASNTPSR